MRGETADHPQAGVDYPGTWAAFLKWFPDDLSCVEFLGGVAVAGWVRVPAVRVGRGLADCRRQILLPGVRLQGVGHVGHDLSWDEDTAD